MPWPVIISLNKLHIRGGCYPGKSHILQNRIRFLQVNVLNRENSSRGFW